MVKRSSTLFISMFCITHATLCMEEKEPTQQDMVNEELFNSISHQHVERTRQMLKAGANPNAIKNRLTALAWSKQYGNEKISKLLVDHGAHPQIQKEQVNDQSSQDLITRLLPQH